MKFFIKNLIIFLFPITIIAVGAEVLLRKIPNDYLYKSDYLNKNSNNLQVLILGASNSFYGIDPEYLKPKSFNAAYVSQSLDYDWRIIEKYDKKFNNLKFIILPIDYVTFSYRLKTGAESWRVKNYNIYYDISDENNITDYSEVLGNKLVTNLYRVINYYLYHKPAMTSSALGWGTEYKYKNRKNLLLTGITAAKSHTVEKNIFSKEFKENVEVLKSIIFYARERNIKVLLYTSPEYKSYVQNLNKNQLDTTIGAASFLAKKYKNVFYYNLLTDKSFDEMDFYDGDHLNEIGAKKLTRKIDSLLVTL